MQKQRKFTALGTISSSPSFLTCPAHFGELLTKYFVPEVKQALGKHTLTKHNVLTQDHTEMTKVQSYQLMGTRQGTQLMTSVNALQGLNSYSYFGLFPSLN